MGLLGKLRLFLSDAMFSLVEFLRGHGNYQLHDIQLVQRLRNARWPEAYWRARQCAKYVSEHESRAQFNERTGDPRDFHYDALQGAMWMFLAIAAVTTVSTLIIWAATGLGVWTCIGYGALTAFVFMIIAGLAMLFHDEMKYFRVELCEHMLAVSNQIWPGIRSIAFADYDKKCRKTPSIEALKDAHLAENQNLV